jgi:hypothetical protein
MTDPHQPKGMLAVAVLLAGGGLVLAREAWIGSPRVHVPPGIAYVLAGVLCATALMIALQVVGVWRWNDLLAAVLLSGVTVELLWLTFGSGPPRTCRWGWWQPPEPVCRAVLAVVTVICGAMTVWAFQRHRARGGVE